MTNIIHQDWPAADLEQVSACPICGHEERTLKYSNVKDWAFGCAPGNWNYWHCHGCASLYLNPRPTITSIAHAYSSYYTHKQQTFGTSSAAKFKKKLRNECMFHWLGIGNEFRLNLKSGFFLNILKPFVGRKFPLDQISKLPRGYLLDVGCGNGDLMNIVKSMGFSVAGIEIDSIAAQTAANLGLSVRQGPFDVLAEYQNEFDYIVCSHVIEHVHDPNKLIELMINATKPGGHIFIAWPNPESIVLRLFGRYWRGLEAPRHLTLVSKKALRSVFSKHDVVDIKYHSSSIMTVGESWRLWRGKSTLTLMPKILNRLIVSMSYFLHHQQYEDFISISCMKSVNKQ